MEQGSIQQNQHEGGTIVRVETKPSRCKECGLCAANCPKGAISFAEHPNAAGYHPAIIDDGVCIACGICYTVCPDGVFHVLGEEV